MACERSRSKAMALAARADGVISVGITGDKDKLEVVGDGVDTVCLASCLRRKLGHAEILQVEEVKDPPPPSQHLRSQMATSVPSNTTTTRRAPPVVICEEPGNCAIV